MSNSFAPWVLFIWFEWLQLEIGEPCWPSFFFFIRSATAVWSWNSKKCRKNHEEFIHFQNISESPNRFVCVAGEFAKTIVSIWRILHLICWPFARSFCHEKLKVAETIMVKITTVILRALAVAVDNHTVFISSSRHRTCLINTTCMDFERSPKCTVLSVALCKVLSMNFDGKAHYTIGKLLQMKLSQFIKWYNEERPSEKKGTHTWRIGGKVKDFFV